MLDRATASAVLPLVGALFGMGLLALCAASLKRSFVAFRKLSPGSQMPEANWPMPGANSLFWHDVTSNGSLRLTWQHALNTDTGMLISSEANLTTLAHEIGHACGLADIYTKRENLGLYLTGEATFVRNQEDWGTDSQRGYYPDGILQQTLVQRDLMCSEVPGTRADIARGDIEGLWYDQAQNPVTGDYEKT